MIVYQFSLIVANSPADEEEMLVVADKLGDCGCTDAAIRGHAKGMELAFDREADSLQAAITSAVEDVEKAGFRVARVELERESLPAS